MLVTNSDQDLVYRLTRDFQRSSIAEVVYRSERFQGICTSPDFAGLYFDLIDRHAPNRVFYLDTSQPFPVQLIEIKSF